MVAVQAMVAIQVMAAVQATEAMAANALVESTVVVEAIQDGAPAANSQVESYLEEEETGAPSVAGKEAMEATVTIQEVDSQEESRTEEAIVVVAVSIEGKKEKA